MTPEPPTAPQAGAAPLAVGRGPRELIAAQRRLNSAASMSELLGDASERARDWCGFARSLVLSVEGDVLSASVLATLPDAASDALRRRALAEPIALRPGTAESELIRHAEGGRPGSATVPSPLAEALELERFALGAVMPEDRVLAVLVVDRADPPVTEDDRAAVQLFSSVLALSVERLFLRVRMKELSSELRHFTASAVAVMHEALESPVSLPRDFGSGPVFPAAFPAPQISDQLRDLLTVRELQIAVQMVAGRSNREIAAELHLSPETVKGYVARVLRKLGATNRVDAVSRYLRLAGGNGR